MTRRFDKSFGMTIARRRIWVAAAGVATALTLIAQPAHAYRTASDQPEYAGSGRIAWQSTPELSVIGDLPSELAWDDADAAVLASVDTWLAPDCMRHEVRYLGNTEPANLERAITIQWVSDWVERGFVETLPGTTDITYAEKDAGWEIVSAAIYLNAERYQWKTADDGLSAAEVDVQAVVTHELGHALGLLHVCEPDGEEGAPVCGTNLDFDRSVMFPTYRGTVQRTLSLDDVDGLCFLYGDGDSPSGCESAVASQCGGECEGGACADAGVRDDRAGGVIGDPCDVAADCNSMFCDESRHCGDYCSDSDRCPDGFACGISGGPLAPATCEPQGRLFGESCDEVDDCASALCLLTEDAGVCTRRCEGNAKSACPHGFVCTPFAGREICVEEPHESESDSGGCAAVGPGRNASSRAWMMTLFGFAALTWRRRRAIED